MQYSTLGRTGIKISKIALGTATFGVAPLDADADALVGRALDLGINVIDTANSYGNQPRFDRPGVPPADKRKSAEEILGSALKGRRDEVILCSKVMEPVGPGPNGQGLSRRHIFQQVEESLSRLATDRLDVYHAHHPDPNVALEETLRAFDDLVRQGKILHFGLSTFGPSMMTEVLWTCDKLGLAPPVCNQIPYHLAFRNAERDLLPACRRFGVSLTSFSPLAGGLLAGAAVEQRAVSGSQRWGGPAFTPAQLELARQLDDVSKTYGIAPAHLALRWLISRDGVGTAIIGPETVAELELNVTALETSVPEEALANVDDIGRLPFSFLAL